MGTMSLRSLSILLRAWCAIGDDSYSLMFKTESRDVSNARLEKDALLPGAPSWLVGDFLLGGPHQFEMGETSFNHAFDAYGRILKFKLRSVDGHIECDFSARMMQTEYYLKAKAAGQICPGVHFEDTVPSLNASMVQKLAGPKDNAYVQQFKFGGKYWSTTDAPITVTYNENLADWNVVKWEDRLSMDLTVTHSMLDLETGKLVGLGTHMPRLPFQKGTVTIYEIDPESPYTRVQLASFKVPRVPYEHGFGLGGGYAVVCAHPFYMEMTKMMSGNLLDALVVDTNGNTTFYLVNLQTGEVEDFTAPPYIIYHFANVHQEDNGDVTFDQTAASCDVYDVFHMPTALSSDALNHFRDNCTNALMRFTLHRSGPLKGTVTSTTLDDGWLEFPQFNQLWRGTRTCYIYLLEWYHGGSQEYSSMALVKFDLCKGTRAAEWAVPGHFPAEPKFIPRPGATDEDDGVLVSPVLDGSAQTSYLIVVDAKTMEPLQRFAVGQHVPSTLHGFWDFADSAAEGRSQIQVV